MDPRPDDERSTSLALMVGAIEFAVVLIGVGSWLAIREVYSSDHHSTSSLSGPSAQLGAHTWTLTSYAGPNGIVHSAAATAKFQLVSSTQLLATDSCKSLGAPVQVTSTDLEIIGVGAQATGCTNADEASVVDAVLTGNVSWRIAGSTLTLTKTGSGTLVYSAG